MFTKWHVKLITDVITEKADSHSVSCLLDGDFAGIFFINTSSVSIAFHHCNFAGRKSKTIPIDKHLILSLIFLLVRSNDCLNITQNKNVKLDFSLQLTEAMIL